VIEVNKKVLTGSGNLNKKERKKRERKKERKTTMVLPSVRIMVLLHFRVWSKVICNPDTGVARIRGPLKTNASF
jgi:hypothetical protein